MATDDTTTGPVPSGADYRAAYREALARWTIDPSSALAWVMEQRAQALAAARPAGGDDAWLASVEARCAAATRHGMLAMRGATPADQDVAEFCNNAVEDLPRLVALVRAAREPRATALTAEEVAELAEDERAVGTGLRAEYEWWCPACKAWLAPEQVAFAEYHDDGPCGGVNVESRRVSEELEEQMLTRFPALVALARSLGERLAALRERDHYRGASLRLESVRRAMGVELREDLGTAHSFDIINRAATALYGPAEGEGEAVNHE